ncbi:MAG: AAA family ATPase, partial [Anaerolineae bacterium]|nr:AAA family ATPase [Anaerolineae bacterium]
DDETLEELQQYHHARSEFLDTLEVEVTIKKAKERAKAERGPFFGRPDPDEDEDFHALKEVGINLSAQVGEQRFRRAYHREDEIEMVLQILMSRRHNSVLVTGPSESGKTAVVHEVVRRILNQDCDVALHEREVWMLTPDRIIAGAQYVGTWEDRINNIVDECRKKRHILYVPDLTGLLEVGRWSKSDMNVGLALKPHIASGEVCIIGEVSAERLTMAQGLGPGFTDLFRRVDILGMSEEETLSMMGNVARDLERELNVRIQPDAMQASVGLSRRFWPYRAFPGKAIRLLEETAADATRLQANPPPATSSRLRRRPFMVRVGRSEVIGAFSRYSGLTEFVVNDETRMTVREVEAFFRARVLGQEEAVQAVVSLMAMVKSGLNDPHKPLGTFMFIGPTGVGKTHMAKMMAGYLFGDEERLIRFDMSEYTDFDGVTRLIGAFDREGELTRRIREQPFSVLLLDEFEKAAPRIYDIFLQVLGEGRLTDAAGRTTLFHNTIVILTSNLGGGSKAFRAPGFTVGEATDPAVVNAQLRSHYVQEVQRYYRPEFVNRLDRTVVFGLLDPGAVRSIARREMNDVLRRDGFTRRNMLVELDETVIDLVLEKGYTPEYGARPLKREIERRVVDPMARQLAERSSAEQHLLRVYVEDGELALKSVPIDDAPKSAVTLGAGGNGAGGKQKLSLSELAEGFALLRRRLMDWAEGDTVKGMQREKSALLSATHTQDFWDDTEHAGQNMRRFYFLDRLTRRLRQLQERAEYLEDFAVIVSRERDHSYQTELAKDYEQLYNNVAFLDIELITARLPHRNHAMMLLSMMGTQPVPPMKPHHAWHRRVSEMYLWWAEHKGYDREVYLLVPDENAPGGKRFVQLRAGNFKSVMKRYATHGPTDEIALAFEGSNVFGFLKGERGAHRRLTNEPGGEELARVQVFALPDNTKVDEWLADYQRIKTDIAEGRQPQPASERHAVIRVYSLDRSDTFIRDQRTNVRKTHIKQVMQQGQLDAFILAYLRTVEAKIGWEDRY